MEDVILRALVKFPTGRFLTVMEMVEAFQRAAAPPRPPTAPIRLASTSASDDETTVLAPAQLHGKDISMMLVLQPTGQLFFVSGKEDSVVLLDGLEYLLVQNDPQKVVKFIQVLVDSASVHHSKLLISFDVKAVNEAVRALITRDLQSV